MSQPIGHHLIFNLRDARVIALDAKARRKLAACVRRVGLAVGVFAFRCSDTHLHVGKDGDRKAAGRAARRIGNGIARTLRLPVPLTCRTFKRIENQFHLERLVPYIFNQESHHGTDADPFHDASSLPDVLGLRTGARWLRDRLLARVPRLALNDLYRFLPPRAAALEENALTLLEDAAAAAACLPDLSGRARATLEARAAAVNVAYRNVLGSAAEIAKALRIERTTVWRARKSAVDNSLAHAIEQQLLLRTRPSPTGKEAEPRLVLPATPAQVAQLG